MRGYSRPITHSQDDACLPDRARTVPNRGRVGGVRIDHSEACRCVGVEEAYLFPVQITPSADPPRSGQTALGPRRH
jgi:hypothetical protein